MTNPAQNLANRLGTPRGKPAKRAGGANWMCLCPAHQDREPSLAIRYIEGPDMSSGRMLYRCYAGCSFDAITSAIRARGLSPFTGEALGSEPDRKYVSRASTKTVSDAEAAFLADYEYAPRESPGWLEDLRANRAAPPGYRRTAYVYRDTDGWPMALLYRYDRLDPMVESRRKMMLTLTPWRHRRTGHLIIPPRNPSRPIPPYGSETLHTPGPVLIVEGEKCRQRLYNLIKGRLPVITPTNAHLHFTDFGPILTSGRRCLTLPDHGNGEAFVEEINTVIGRHNTVITSPWRLGDTPIPMSWDIADEIDGKRPYSNVEITPLTVADLIDHLTDELDRANTGPDSDTISAAITALQQ